jgi:hypothetical protein
MIPGTSCLAAIVLSVRDKPFVHRIALDLDKLAVRALKELTRERRCLIMKLSSVATLKDAQQGI